jgi:hypothetical protein
MPPQLFHPLFHRVVRLFNRAKPQLLCRQCSHR